MVAGGLTGEPEQASADDGQNLEDLVEVKGARHPVDLFHCVQSIPITVRA